MSVSCSVKIDCGLQDEVRALGRLPAMGVPESFVARHPFPGPGLAVRVLGDVTAADHLSVLREVRVSSVNARGMSLFGTAAPTHAWQCACFGTQKMKIKPIAWKRCAPCAFPSSGRLQKMPLRGLALLLLA